MFPWSAHTFKPHKKVADGSKQSEMQKYVATTLGSGNLRLAVQLPDGEDLNEWLAANSLQHRVSLFLSFTSLCFTVCVCVFCCAQQRWTFSTRSTCCTGR